MKTKILLSVVAAFLFSININAKNPETITFSNVEKTEAGCTKEFLSCDKDTKAPISKTVYQYDADERIQQKATYEWDGNNKEWVGIQKYIYAYDKDNNPLAPAILKWNKKAKAWNDK